MIRNNGLKQTKEHPKRQANHKRYDDGLGKLGPWEVVGGYSLNIGALGTSSANRGLDSAAAADGLLALTALK